MDDKEKLIELLEAIPHPQRLYPDLFVDSLIANGVAVQGAPDANVGHKWIPVDDERKPKDRNNYFVAYVFGDSDMHFFGEAKYHAYEGNGIVDRSHFSNEGVGGMRVTHWMEIPKLPQPPKGGDGHA